MIRKILITGSSGQLGSELKSVIKNKKLNALFISKKKINICHYKKLYEVVKKNKITHLINCASYTDVNKAE